VFVASSMDCRMTSETANTLGICGGIAVAAAVFFVSMVFMKGEKLPESKVEFERYAQKTRLFHPFVYLASAAYFVVFAIIFIYRDPHGLFPYLDAIYAVIIAGIIGAALEVTCTWKRTNYRFKNKDLAREYLKMIQYSSMQFFHTTVWVFMTILVAFGAFAFIQGFLRVPPEISAWPGYVTAMSSWVLLTLIPVLGAGFGIVMPALNRVKLAEDGVAALDYG